MSWWDSHVWCWSVSLPAFHPIQAKKQFRQKVESNYKFVIRLLISFYIYKYRYFIAFKVVYELVKTLLNIIREITILSQKIDVPDGRFLYSALQQNQFCIYILNRCAYVLFVELHDFLELYRIHMSWAVRIKFKKNEMYANVCLLNPENHAVQNIGKSLVLLPAIVWNACYRTSWAVVTTGRLVELCLCARWCLSLTSISTCGLAAKCTVVRLIKYFYCFRCSIRQTSSIQYFNQQW